MRSVNVARLKDQLSKYLAFARAGEDVVIRDRNLPVAKLVPFPAGDSSEEELLLAAAGKMRLPEAKLDLRALRRIRTGRVAGNRAIRAVLAERNER